MKKRRKCIDPTVGANIPLEILRPIVAGDKSVPENLSMMPDFSPMVRQHMEECESCRTCLEQNLGLWYQKAESARKMHQAIGIVAAYAAKDSTILHRDIGAGTALFKPYADGIGGLFVLLEESFFFPNDPEETTLEEFNQMQ